jgi:hypothetical protein
MKKTKKKKAGIQTCAPLLAKKRRRTLFDEFCDTILAGTGQFSRPVSSPFI